jgi:hypothetical protein
MDKLKALWVKVKTFCARLWLWIKHDGKTTAAAILYASIETIMIMPDIHFVTLEDLSKRVVRVLGVTAIGVFARDRKPVTPQLPPSEGEQK